MSFCIAFDLNDLYNNLKSTWQSPYSWVVFLYIYTLDMAPSQDSSDHQDYEPFLVGDPYKLSFATVTVRGAISNIYCL